MNKKRIIVNALLMLVLSVSFSHNLYAASKGSQSTTPLKPGLATAGGSSDTLPPGATGNWLEAVKEDIRRSEYNISWQENVRLEGLRAAWQAPNRAHNLRTYFTEKGIHIVPRTETEPGWQWNVNLTGYGYAEEIKPVGPGKLHPIGPRMK